MFTTRRLLGRIALAIAVFAAPLAAAGEPILLPMSFDVSPDGKHVVFEWNGDLWRAAVAGGRVTRLTTHDATDASPRFSPDGKHIAFVSSRDAGTQVFVMIATGGRPEQLTWHTDGYALEGWYPDGEGLLVSASRDAHWRHARRLMRIARTGRTAERALFNAFGRDADLSPDATRVAFVREGERWWRRGYRGARAAQIWLRDLDAKTYRKVSEDGIPHEWPLFAPDGTHLYYVSEKSGTRNLWRLAIDSGKRTQLTNYREHDVTFPRLSRDGSTIVFRMGFDLWAMPTAGGAAKKIPLVYEGDTLHESTERRRLQSATAVAFTGDGKQIAFVAGGDVWVMDRELREPRRVTATASAERDVLFTKDGNALYFIATRDGRVDIFKATRKNPKRYWWLNDAFVVKRVTDDDAVESSLGLRPDGKRLSFVRAGGELWTMKLDGSDAKQVVASWNPPRYDWSPDGKWFVYAVQDNDFNSDIWIAKADGSAPAYNVSRHPDRDSSPVWSPDGRRIAFVGQRTHREADVYYVNLRKEDEETSSRDRKLKKALDAMKSGAKKAAGKGAASGGRPSGDRPRRGGRRRGGEQDPPAQDPPAKAKPKKAAKGKPADDDKKKDKKKDDKKKGKKPAKKKPKPVRIDFDRLHERIHRISVRNSRESGLIWSLDSKTLYFNATVDGARGVYSVKIPEGGTPKKVSSSGLSGARWITKAKAIGGLSSGTPATMSASGSRKTFAFDVRDERDRRAHRLAAFDVAWGTMRERFYDGEFNGLDWDATREKYRAAAGACAGTREFETVVNMMLGELNASHMGFRASRGGGGRFARRGGSGRSRTWQPSTVHLGVRFDLSRDEPGLMVTEVIPGGPAEKGKTRLRVGDVITAIDGVPVDTKTDLTTVLNRTTDHDYRLAVTNAKGKKRSIRFRATTTRSVRRLLYEKMLADGRDKTDTLSKGRLGYLHIAGMNWSSFERFEAELYAVGYGKEGLVIDVRDNGGGSTTDHLLTVLCQPRHAITVPRRGGRGYPQDRRVYATWHKPIIVLCNQNSYSNAEIFSHAVKNLGRGKLVGVQTAGGVISTGSARVLDVGTIRVPFRGWFLPNGEDMELCGAMPDYVIWPKPGELPAGIDRQLEKAVEVLLAECDEAKKQPIVKLRYARERRADGTPPTAGDAGAGSPAGTGGESK